MADDAAFFRSQAALQRATAMESTLDNVRERCERAAASWDAMASRAEHSAALKAKREQRAAESAHDTV